MIKNIIFDWSGVLDDNIKTQYCASMAVLKAYGTKSISMQEYREEFNLPYMSFYKKYNSKITKKRQDEIFKASFPKCPKSRLYPGMKTLLKKCQKADKKVILVTSDHKVYLYKLLQDYGIKNYFDEIMYSVHEKRIILNKIIKKYRLNKRNTLYVGDTVHEVEVCKSLKLLSAGVTWGVCTDKKMSQAKPNYVVRNIKDLNRIIF
ncbi:HAD hydrolase-like protein [Patescibacteria group bacterium]|nr:HAD hydrolase-like protein [Patescibacteria group bacterium]MBU1890771.1 HAD hydrolase-like protein [Patescibacteria group bacterium]